MTGERTADLFLYGALIVLPLSALLARRTPWRRTLLLILAWIGIFTVGLLIAGERDRFARLFQSRSVSGKETRIRIAADGHFWAAVAINGVSRRMLIDSGATTTAISQATADAARLDTSVNPFPVVLNTANGQVTARTATAARIVVGNATARDLNVVVSPAFGDTDVIGMNFLSQLASWRVEDDTLVLTPQSSADHS
jgi:aspartyl protease family protein